MNEIELKCPECGTIYWGDEKEFELYPERYWCVKCETEPQMEKVINE